MIFLPLSIVSWLLYLLLVDLPFYLLGLILVPIATAFRALEIRASTKWPEYGMLTQWRWRFMYPWGNEEDGVDGTRGLFPGNGVYAQQRWILKTYEWSWARRIIAWSAIRNPSGNLRFIKPFGFVPAPEKVVVTVKPLGNAAIAYTQHGLYTGLHLSWDSGAEFRIGWDTWGLTANDYRLKGCGFKLLIRRGAK